MTQVTRLEVTDWLAFIEFNFLYKLSGKTQVKLATGWWTDKKNCV